MKQLLELEKKVLEVIQKNRQLQSFNGGLKVENTKLRDKCAQLEGSLLKEHDNKELLTKEKTAVKGAIEELLEGIKAIEKTG
jgi:hypothetical protein